MPVNEIRMHAETIWLLLSQQGEMTLRELGEATHFNSTMLFISLGWLCREGRINLSQTNGVLSAWAKINFPEQYY